MGDANEGICGLLQCGISYLFDPDIEGAAKNGCTHRLLLFSHLPLTNEARRARGRVVETTKDKSNETRSPLPSIAFTRSFEGRRAGLGLAPPRSALSARISFETSRSLRVASPTRVKRHASTELAPHASGTSTATSSLEYRVFTVPAPYLSRNFFTTSPTCASSVRRRALVVNVFPLAARRMVGVLSKFLYQSVSDPFTGSR